MRAKSREIISDIRGDTGSLAQSYGPRHYTYRGSMLLVVAVDHDREKRRCPAVFDFHLLTGPSEVPDSLNHRHYPRLDRGRKLSPSNDQPFKIRVP